MANLGYLNLVKDINVEGWEEYLERKAWAEKRLRMLLIKVYGGL